MKGRTSAKPQFSDDANDRNRKHKNEENRKRALSKALSWVLRHGAPSLKLAMSTDGYVPLSAVLQSSNKLKRFGVNDVREVVETNDKRRFGLCMRRVRFEDPNTYSFPTDDDTGDMGEMTLCIRANQGHSISGLVFEELLTPIPPEELANLQVIVHGTNKTAWENHISISGLNRMKRNHIHFARDLPHGNVISGMRTSCDVHVYVDGGRCARDGVKFYRSENGVILTAGATEDGTLPVRYFSKVIDVKSGEDLLEGIDVKGRMDGRI